MLSRRTIIGFIVGIAIIGVGVVSLINHVALLTIEENYTVEIGESISYTIPAPIGTAQTMNISGEAFDLSLKSPGDGYQIPKTSYKKELKLDWEHSNDGETKIGIQNTGNSELIITGTLVRSSEPIWFTYDLMVIISGMVIIGFSMGFTLRKPKGF